MKIGDKVRLKPWPKGSVYEFYTYESDRYKVYEIENITDYGEVYVVGRVNYFRQSSLEVVNESI